MSFSAAACCDDLDEPVLEHLPRNLAERLQIGVVWEFLSKSLHIRTFGGRSRCPVSCAGFYAALNALVRARIVINHLFEPGARKPVNRAARLSRHCSLRKPTPLL
jgi:hypothetical protein